MDPKLERALGERRKTVEDALARSLHDLRPPTLRDAARWYPDAGGKRLRPVMALLAAEAAGGRAEDALPIAVAVELVHNFSLVHDDIMDQDATRRGRPTVHTKWDEATAILAGDVLLARAFEALATTGSTQRALPFLARAVTRLCEGQALDVGFERAPRVTPADYLDMIQGKTAVLFEASTRGGALAAAGPGDAADALGAYGDAFGMAFQIADDLLDVTADAKTMGKPWGSDVRGGKRTLLVLEALERADGAQRAVIERALGRRDATDAEVRAAVDAMRACGALSHAEAARDGFAKKADDALRTLPDSDAREALRALNSWAATRGA